MQKEKSNLKNDLVVHEDLNLSISGSHSLSEKESRSGLVKLNTNLVRLRNFEDL